MQHSLCIDTCKHGTDSIYPITEVHNYNDVDHIFVRTFDLYLMTVILDILCITNLYFALMFVYVLRSILDLLHPMGSARARASGVSNHMHKQQTKKSAQVSKNSSAAFLPGSWWIRSASLRADRSYGDQRFSLVSGIGDVQVGN